MVTSSSSDSLRAVATLPAAVQSIAVNKVSACAYTQLKLKVVATVATQATPCGECTAPTPDTTAECTVHAPLFTISVVSSRTFLMSRFSFSCDCKQRKTAHITPLRHDDDHRLMPRHDRDHAQRDHTRIPHMDATHTGVRPTTNLLEGTVQLLILQPEPLQTLVTHKLGQHLHGDDTPRQHARHRFVSISSSAATGLLVAPGRHQP